MREQSLLARTGDVFLSMKYLSQMLLHVGMVFSKFQELFAMCESKGTTDLLFLSPLAFPPLAGITFQHPLESPGKSNL